MGPLDIAVNVALPAITEHFALPLADVQWLVIAYVLTYASLMLVCGKLGDLFGHRLIFRLGMAMSIVGCSLCAAAPDWSLFLWARVAQGVGTALALSCTPALATSLFPESERTKALAGFASAMAIATAAGPILGGVVTELWGWPAVFWMRVPIAFAALALSGFLPAPKPDPRPFDFWGAIVLMLFLYCFLVGVVLSQRDDAPKGMWMGVLLSSAVALWHYVRHARTIDEPILRPTLFADVGFTVPNIINVLANLAAFALLLLTPYYLIDVLKLSPLTGGLMLSLVFIGSLAGAPLAARLVPGIGQRPAMVAGVAAVGLGLLPLAFTTETTPVGLVAVLLLFVGVGNGLLTVAYTDLVTGALPARDRGVAGALSLLTRTIGVVLGASVLTALHAKGVAGSLAADPFLDGYRFAFLAAAGGLLGALSLSCLIPRVWFSR
ncbi:MAG TPA: MFS transporter [Reyranellaceae bacterium]|nr:MFS transporter [Reyranellaceae bacterium]